MTIIFAPLVALIIQLAISRSREYRADEVGSYISGKPEALVRALKKLELLAQQLSPQLTSKEIKPYSSHMFIFNPFKGGFLKQLFSTHPSIEKRVKHLQKIGKSITNC